MLEKDAVETPRRSRDYVFVESRSTLEGEGVEALLELAEQLAGAGHTVSLFLVQNAVLMAVDQARTPLARLCGNERISVWADSFSLATRALDEVRLVEGVRIGAMADLVRMVMKPGAVPVWH